MALSDFTIIRRSLTSRFFSTVLTAVTVAVAVGLMLVLLAMRDAGFRAFERGSGDMHMVISRDASPLVAVLNEVFLADAPPRSIEWSKYLEITGPGYQGNPRPLPLAYAIPVQIGDSYRGFPVVATTRDLFTEFRPVPDDEDGGWSLRDGRIFDAAFEVVLGSEVARATGLAIGEDIALTHGAGGAEEDESADEGDDEGEDEDEHGDEDEAHGGGHVHRGFEYTVVGVLAPTGGPHDRALFTNLDSTWIIHAHGRRERENPEVETTTIDDLTEDDRLITGIYARVESREGRMLSGGQQMVFDILRRDPTLTVAAPSDQIDSLFKIVNNIDQIFLGMAAVVMVASAIAILLALYNSMEQRRRQIAVLRVLGASRGRIFGLVVTESAVIGLIGAILGVALAIAGGLLVADVMKERLGLVIEPSLPINWAVVVVTAAIVLAAIAGFLPALMAYRTSVAKNLRPIG